MSNAQILFDRLITEFDEVIRLSTAQALAADLSLDFFPQDYDLF